MRLFVKLLLFACLMIGMAFLCGKLTQSLNKELRFGEEFIGLTEPEIIEKFGVPDLTENRDFYRFEDDFHYFFEYFENDCNKNDKVKYFLYNKLLFDYEFWFKTNDQGEEIVVLVK